MTTLPAGGITTHARRSSLAAAGAAPAREVPLYAKRENIYQREAHGPWQRLRAVTLFILAGFYLVLPWLTWEGRQAVWFDLPRRKFYLFDLTFWPQDFIFLSWLLIIAALGLFFFTALAGRLWCGYACPQTVWTKVFMWIEWIAEGDRNQRIRLDRGPWTGEKVARKSAKHALWLGVAIVVGTTFVGYFVPIRGLVARMATFDVTTTETVALAFFTLALYFDAGWMREQICTYVCPYARFQGAMFDTATLTIFYDPARGEPRGHRARSVTPAEAGLGDCIDCGLCVHVCPTGIDIRNGTQYECIGCAACIDACDEIMAEMHYSKGLVRYATEESLRTGTTRILRPRLVAYGAVIAGMVTLFGYALSQRVPLQLDVLRDRARLYRYTPDGKVENTYMLKIMNMDQHPHAYRITTEAIAEASLAAPEEVRVGADEIVDVPVRVQVPPDQLPRPSLPVVFHVESKDDPRIGVREDSRFIAPSMVGR